MLIIQIKSKLSPHINNLRHPVLSQSSNLSETWIVTQYTIYVIAFLPQIWSFGAQTSPPLVLHDAGGAGDCMFLCIAALYTINEGEILNEDKLFDYMLEMRSTVAEEVLIFDNLIVSHPTLEFLKFQLDN